VPRSEELPSFVSIAILVAMGALLAPSLLQWLGKQLAEGLSCNTAVFSSAEAFTQFAKSKITEVLVVILPIVAALSIGAVIAGIAVSGINFSPQAISLRFSAINPVVGFGNLINTRSLVRLLTAVVKLLFVSVIVWMYLQDRLNGLATLRWAWSLEILEAIGKVILGLMVRICLALLVISLAETFYQKWKYIQDLKMTKQEVKEERRQQEGAPEVRSRIRKLQYEMAMKRMLQEVPKASVVLVNPTHVAVALRYDAKTMEAPVLVAKGADNMAEKIREIARAYGVPILHRPELARTIYATVEVDNPIPEDLYIAVAEVLALIYRLRRRR